jgi:hypothetical protein
MRTRRVKEIYNARMKYVNATLSYTAYYTVTFVEPLCTGRKAPELTVTMI